MKKRDYIIFFLLREYGLFISCHTKKNKFTLGNIESTTKTILGKNVEHIEGKITGIENILDYVQKNCSYEDYLKAEKFIFKRL
ncbi:MAG: hypothetical protein K9H48_07680 [Melioribacteraceae bacterium]|nr:hypothetical protein [Melioribacteraceae bacterium]